MAFLLKLYDSFIDKILDTANLKSENLSDDEEKNQIENAAIEKPNNEITFQQQNKEIVDSNKKKNFNNQNSIDDYMGSPDKFDRTGGKEKLKNKHRKTFNFGVDDFYKNDDVEDYYVGMKNIESDMMEINLDFKGMINSKKTVADKNEELIKKQNEINEKKKKEKEKKIKPLSKFSNYIHNNESWMADDNVSVNSKNSKNNKDESKVDKYKNLNNSLNGKYNNTTLMLNRTVIKFVKKNKKANESNNIGTVQNLNKSLNKSSMNNDKTSIYEMSILNKPKDMLSLGEKIKKSFSCNRINDLNTPDILEDINEEKFVRGKGQIVEKVREIKNQISKFFI